MFQCLVNQKEVGVLYFWKDQSGRLLMCIVFPAAAPINWVCPLSQMCKLPSHPRLVEGALKVGGCLCISFRNHHILQVGEVT